MKLKTLKTVEDFEQLKKGQVIYICDGEIEPPKHHKKKHRTWCLNNYKGFVHRFGYSCGRYEITIDSTGKGGMVYCYSINQLTFKIEDTAEQAINADTLMNAICKLANDSECDMKEINIYQNALGIALHKLSSNKDALKEIGQAALDEIGSDIDDIRYTDCSEEIKLLKNL